MIISRTPYRVSFFGGGSDYPAWYRENKGTVLSTTIDKYAWITCRYLPPFFEHKHRIVWSQIELVHSIDEIRHPSFRETLRFMSISNGVEIHHNGDLPAMSGMGTSSSFTVGLLHALYALKGITPTKEQLAKEAIYIEQKLIKENVGSQDQVAAAYGGLNCIDFGTGDDIEVHPIVLKKDRLGELQNHLMLFFTGFSRTASEIAEEQIRNIEENTPILRRFCEMVVESLQCFCSRGGLVDFGRLLGEAWVLKKRLSERVSTEYIDYLYKNALEAGAIGGKLLGAGGGGFLLLFAEPDAQESVRKKLSSLLYVPFQFEDQGSQVIFHDSR